MKKQIYLLVSLFALIGFSMNASAQSTGTNPYPGANHNYRVNGGTNTSGSSYAWSVLDDAYASASAKVTISPIGTGSTTDAQVNILWNSTVAATEIYYVQVIETNNLCTNTKVFKVVIAASTFDVTASAPTPCWTPVNVTIDGTTKEPIYNHGSATIVYTFVPKDNQGQYKFSYAIPASTPFTWAIPTLTGGTIDALPAATGNAGTVTSEGDGNITLTFVITRPTTSNATDNLGTAADFSSNLTISEVKTGVGFTISESTSGQLNNLTNVSVARPNTTNIETF